MKRMFKVGTFYYARKGRKPVTSRIGAHTLNYHPNWPGCIEYTIEAESGADARREAARRRLALELQLLEGPP